jgi:hypothetical protein
MVRRAANASALSLWKRSNTRRKAARESLLDLYMRAMENASGDEPAKAA